VAKVFLSFYGFNEKAFGVPPDPKYFCLGASHREALASPNYGIESSFLALIGKPGASKTSLRFHLLERLCSTAHTAKETVEAADICLLGAVLNKREDLVVSPAP
jgi:hypothetical protein